ncbi:MAG: bifunctional 5,10-methylenetetrahydrofolate dehydrogenase/5,10-methenyltetrahydrofolate cyclohydrolase [Candidatus Paceibacterota bacterium]|jgi:methylenetetrahydrofolate dehydrogenase (NADP+)/methenyltetrahydrofolate cyclohydrolase
MKLLYGKPTAEKILGDVKKKIAESGVTPGLAVILVGDDRASHIYVSLKEKKAKENGFYFEKHVFLADVKTSEITGLIEELNDKPNIHGILVQLPLPTHTDTEAVIAAIAPVKDADGFHKETIRKFLDADVESAPVFPQAIIEIIKESGVSLSNKKVAIVVNSALFGGVLQKALENIGLAVRIIQLAELSQNISALKEADIIVTACGKPKLITGGMVKGNCLVVDGGTCELHGKTVGDVDVQSMENTDVVLTSVPGGVGPLTVACLLRRAARLAGVAV